MPPSGRFIIFDHSLRGVEGHQFDYSRSVIEAATLAGVRCELICHGAFSDDHVAGAPVVGRYLKWDATGWRSAGRRMAAMLPRTLRHFALRRLPLRRLAQDSRPDVDFAREFVRLVSAAELQVGDQILLHTVLKPEFLGLADALSQTPFATGKLHIVLRYDGDNDYRPAFARLARSGGTVRFWTDTEPLAEQYRELGCRSIGVLPIPPGLDAERPATPGPSSRLTLAFLGGARKDKGFHLLPEMIDALSGSGTLRTDIRFLIQTTFATSRHEPLMAETRRRLRAFPRELVELIEVPPQASAFRSLLLATDLLLLPYEAETYRRRSSGLLVQAMVLGIPTVVPAGTWLATEVPAGAHVAFDRGLPLADAVRRALEQHAALRSAALTAVEAASRKHDAAVLVRKILDA